MMDIDALIGLFGEDDMDLEFKLGGETVFEVRTKDKNIDVTISDAKTFKDLVRRVKRCKS